MSEQTPETLAQRLTEHDNAHEAYLASIAALPAAELGLSDNDLRGLVEEPHYDRPTSGDTSDANDPSYFGYYVHEDEAPGQSQPTEGDDDENNRSQGLKNWFLKAKCRKPEVGVLSYLFFPDDQSTIIRADKIERARKICLGCSVIDTCFETAYSRREKSSVWGGEYFDANGRPTHTAPGKIKLKKYTKEDRHVTD